MLFFIFGLLAAGVALADDTCISKYYGKPCLTADKVPEGFASFFNSGNPCFKWSGGNWCFFTDKGNLAPCDPGQQFCSSGETYVPPTPKPSPKCDKAEQTTSCDKSYCSYGKKHTMCKYCGTNAKFCDKVCARVITDLADKDAIVAKHNELRRRVAKGLETKGVNGGQPSATDMYELKWNDELAEVAQRWADQCWPTENGKSKAHDTKRGPSANYKQVGQNMATGASTAPISSPGFEGMIQGWYDEVEDFPADNVSAFSKNGVPKGKMIGHYTQVVWGATKEVGCGYVSFDNPGHPKSRNGKFPYRKLLICNYGKAGNWGGQKVYTAGATASNCKNGSNDGLCTW